MSRHLTPDRWARAEKLFHAAAELPFAGRDRFVDEETGEDRELRDEVVSLLRYDTRAEPGIVGVLQAEAANFLAAEPAVAGRMLGPWRIEREIGRGGMSVVYLGTRADGEFDKLVAIKVIKRGMDTDAVIARMRRERGILAALGHPSIARLLDGGTTPEGLPWIVMEYVEGAPIDRYCDENGLGIEQRCELVAQVCDAVAYAHRNLVVHRDLKPGNILVGLDGRPKLLDFGIAKLLVSDTAEENGETLLSTRGFVRPFTPGYASPEQIGGGVVTTPTDVYSLGVVLFELLAGARPRGEAEDASAAALREGKEQRWAGRLRGDLDTILRKALDPDPERRYHSVEQLQLDLDRHRDGLPIAARRESLVYRAGKFFRRHRFGSLAAAAAVIALGAGLGATLWEARVARDERDVAQRGREEAERQRIRAEESARREQTAHNEAAGQKNAAELQKTLAETQRALAERRFEQVRELAKKFTTDIHDAVASLPGSTPARKLLVETGLRYYDSLAAEASGNQPLLEEIARGYDKLGDAQGNAYYANLGDPKAAMASYRKAEAIRARVRDDGPGFLADRIQGNIRIAQILMLTGEMRAATPVLERTLKMARESPGANDYWVLRGQARTWMALGDLKNQSGDLGAAIGPYENLLAVWTVLSGMGKDPVVERAGTATSHAKLGEAYARMERGPEALAHLRPALEMDRQLSANEPNSIPRMRKMFFDNIFMSWVFSSAAGASLGTTEEARGVLDQAVRIADRMASTDQGNDIAIKDVATAHMSYSIWLTQQGDYSAAHEHTLKAAAAIDRYTAGKPSAMEYDDAQLEIRLRLADEYGHLDKPSDAIAQLAAAVPILDGLQEQHPGQPHWEVHRAEIAAANGWIRESQKDWPGAIDYYKAAVSVMETQVKADPKNDGLRNSLIRDQSDLADCYGAAGETPAARAAAGSVLTGLREIESARALSSAELKLRASGQERLEKWK